MAKFVLDLKIPDSTYNFKDYYEKQIKKDGEFISKYLALQVIGTDPEYLRLMVADNVPDKIPLGLFYFSPSHKALLLNGSGVKDYYPVLYDFSRMMNEAQAQELAKFFYKVLSLDGKVNALSRKKLKKDVFDRINGLSTGPVPVQSGLRYDPEMPPVLWAWYTEIRGKAKAVKLAAPAESIIPQPQVEIGDVFNELFTEGDEDKIDLVSLGDTWVDFFKSLHTAIDDGGLNVAGSPILDSVTGVFIESESLEVKYPEDIGPGIIINAIGGFFASIEVLEGDDEVVSTRLVGEWVEEKDSDGNLIFEEELLFEFRKNMREKEVVIQGLDGSGMDQRLKDAFTKYYDEPHEGTYEVTVREEGKDWMVTYEDDEMEATYIIRKEGVKLNVYESDMEPSLKQVSKGTMDIFGDEENRNRTFLKKIATFSACWETKGLPGTQTTSGLPYTKTKQIFKTPWEIAAANFITLASEKGDILLGAEEVKDIGMSKEQMKTILFSGLEKATKGKKNELKNFFDSVLNPGSTSKIGDFSSKNIDPSNMIFSSEWNDVLQHVYSAVSPTDRKVANNRIKIIERIVKDIVATF